MPQTTHNIMNTHMRGRLADSDSGILLGLQTTFSANFFAKITHSQNLWFVVNWDSLSKFLSPENCFCRRSCIFSHKYKNSCSFGWIELLTLPVRGGANLVPPLTFLLVASKRMYMFVRNFLTFHIKYENFKQNLSSYFLTLSPLWVGYIKWRHWKTVRRA